MAKFRIRAKGSKGKRWRKGQSSSSNPESKTYRNAAKTRFFQEVPNSKSELTTEALEKHDVFMRTKIVNNEDDALTDETCSIGTFKTFQTFASDWSECSNTSFNRLLKGFDSRSALQKEMLAVLAAVTEVIKTNGGKETSTEYFGALMTTLQANENEDSIAAILSLLSMGIKTVPENVLKLKFSDVIKVFFDHMSHFVSSSNNVIMRQLIGCLSVVLRVQDAGVWSLSSTVVVFDSILSFTIHSKPKVRKAAQHAVCAILKGSTIMLGNNPPPCHPAAIHAAKFCVLQLESGGSLGGSTMILHVLGLLKDILMTFPRTELKQTCECILKVMTLGNVLVLSCGMQALHGLLLMRPPSTRLPEELNAQLLSALYDYQPAPTDVQPTLAWLAVMQEGFINLASLNLNLWCANLPRFFNTASQLWLSERKDVMSGATLAMEAVLENTMKEACSSEKIKIYGPIIHKIIQTAESGLKYQYHSAWPYVLHLLGSLFEATGETCFNLLEPCLKSLGELRDTEQFTYKNELENAVGHAVKALGPEKVLSSIPLQITGLETSYEFRRSWMLTVLKDNIRGAPLKFFINYFLPLATICRKQAQTAESQVAVHSYNLLQSQIWALLPSFCYDVPDLKESFKGIARILGVVITDHKDLRIPVMASLRRLIVHSKENYKTDDIDELKKFAKNYLPILFNVYTTKAVGSDEEGQRLAAFETIKVYLTISNPELTTELFIKAYEKLDREEIEEFTKECIFDLLRVLIPYQSLENLKIFYDRIEKAILDTERRQQKKCYRLLEEICGSSSENCQNFVKEYEVSLENLLLNSLGTCSPSTKGPRLRCLIYLMKGRENVAIDVLKRIIPEAILCCKDINQRCRFSAFSLLIHIGEAMQRSSGKNSSDSLQEYFELVMAGLCGTTSLVSATLLALGTLAFEFRDIISEDLKKFLLENVCLHVVSTSREVVSSALNFIKTYLVSTPMVFLGPSVPAIMKSLLAMTEDCKRHFRMKTRDILARFIRKFGYEPIASLVPASDTIMLKRLRNLRKIYERKKRTSRQMGDDSDDDSELLQKGRPKTIEEILEESDSDFEDQPEKERRPKQKKPRAYILEDADSIVDFTDAGTAKKIVVSLPEKKNTILEKKKKKEIPFKMSSDGRFIITDNDSADEGSRKQKFSMNFPEDSDEEWDDLKSRASSVKGSVNRKRKLTFASEASEPPAKYQAGGSGIHRPVVKVKSKNQNAKGPMSSLNTGEVYKAKKAKGDVKKKGLPDPYAYVPLSRSMLNKRKKMKHAGKFKNLIGAAHKGAIKGKKVKAKKRMRK